MFYIIGMMKKNILILKNIHKAVVNGKRKLLIAEYVLNDVGVNEHMASILLFLNKIHNSGHLKTRREWQQILSNANFRLDQVLQIKQGFCLIEATAL